MNTNLQQRDSTKPSAGRAETDTRPLRVRSRVTNGKSLFVQGDGNSAWARRFRDLLYEHAADLGGPDLLSEGQRSLIRRIACLEIECERLEGRMSEGDAEASLSEYVMASNALRRLLVTVGLRRVPRKVETLDSYLAARARQDGAQ